MVAVDSAEARREVQSSLPGWISNGWTQTGDLGVSQHSFHGGACLACLYLPHSTSTSEDEVVARALKIPEQLMLVRDLLYRGMPAPESILELIAERLGIDPDHMADYAQRPLRTLYVEGICGGALVPAGIATPQMHVPLAHQSALAGVLLAARFARRMTGVIPTSTLVTRVDVRRDVSEFPHQAAGKDPRGICICQDQDYINAYLELWPRGDCP